MGFKKHLIISAVALGAIVIPWSQSAEAQEFYAGKKITMLMGFPPGSPADVFGRLIARAAMAQIPGKPTLVTRNMPGAGGMKAANFLVAKGKRDGTMIMYQPFSPMGEILGDPGQRYKIKDLTWLAGVKHLGRLSYIRTDIIPGGIKKASDVTKITRIVRAGGGRPSNSNDLRLRLSLALLGVKYRYIPGYRGFDKARLAIFRNENDYGTTTVQAYRLNVLRANKQAGGNVVTGLWHYPLPDGNGGFHKNPEAKDLPSFVEVYKEVRGKAPSGIMWESMKTVLELHGSSAQMLWGPPGVPKERTEILRKAIFAGMSSKGFRDQIFGMIKMYMDPVSTATGLADVQRVYNVKPEIVKFLSEEIRAAAGATRSKRKKGKKG